METGLSCVGRFWSLLSFLAASAASVGFFMPYWLEGVIRHEDGIYKTHFGVFRRCNYLMPAATEVSTRKPVVIVLVEQCGRYMTFWDIPSIWWQAATVAVGVGCGLSILVAFSALLCCCIQDSMSKNLSRIAGAVQLLAGFCIAAGCISYAVGWNNVEVRAACGPQADSFNHGSCKMSWAYYATISGGSCLFLCSLLGFLQPNARAVTKELLQKTRNVGRIFRLFQ